MTMYKSLWRNLFCRVGLDLRRYSFQKSERDQFKAMLSAHGVNLILDVGANIGQFGVELRELGYRGRIVSFEPMTKAREYLLNAKQGDPHWLVAPQAAIGDVDGEIEINISRNSQSSSVLKMLDAHEIAAPESKYVGTELVPIRCLDSIASEYLSSGTVPFLKVDTQGYEDKVLDGAKDILKQVVGIQLELSLVPLYEGQSLYQEMIQKMEAIGFELWSISPVFVEPKTGRLLQIDATFFKNGR